TMTPVGAVLDGNGGNDYSYTYATSANGVINGKSLTSNVTAANRTYDGTTAATITGRSLTGVVAGDTVSRTGGTGPVTTKTVHRRVRQQDRRHGQDGDRDGPRPLGRRLRQLRALDDDRDDDGRHHRGDAVARDHGVEQGLRRRRLGDDRVALDHRHGLRHRRGE